MSKYIARTVVLIFSLLFTVSSFAKSMSDYSITAGVKSKIVADKTLAGTHLKISTLNGVVKIVGTVESETQATSATETAQSTAGVKDVDTSKLNVKGSDQVFTDSFITAKTKGLFIQQKLFGDKDIAAIDIKVETNNGVVSLSGTVDTQVQADNAVKIAKSVAGVKDVQSSIKISAVNNQ